MPRSIAPCIHSDNSRQPPDARGRDLVVPRRKGLAAGALGQTAGTMGCKLARALVHRVRFAED